MELTAEIVVFAVFSVLTLAGGVGVALTRNLFRSALMLLVSLFGVAGLFVLLAAPFLAVVQVLIYMGAIAILIIFAVMLTRGMVTARRVMNDQWSVAAVVALFLFAVLVVIFVQVGQGENAVLPLNPTGDPPADGTAALGQALLDPGQYVLPFEVAALLLAGVLSGAVYIARDDEPDEPSQTRG